MSQANNRVITKAGTVTLQAAPPAGSAIELLWGQFSVKANNTVTFGGYTPPLVEEATSGRDIGLPPTTFGEAQPFTVTTSSNAKTTIKWTTRIVAVNQPVDCVVSAWGPWSDWTPVNSTIESRTRTRTVVTSPQHGGQACPTLTDTETRTINTPGPGERLLTPDDMTYLGAFRVPADTYSYNQGVLTYRADHNSLILGVNVSAGARMVGEISIPAPGTGPRQTLPRAVAIHDATDILDGHIDDVVGNGSGNYIGGVLVQDNALYVNVFSYYGDDPNHLKSLFKTSAAFGAPFNVVGPVEVPVPTLTSWTALPGATAGVMTPIPTEWQSAFGGTALTGQCALAVMSRSSFGPSLVVIDPAQVGVTPLTATPVLCYPNDHQTLGPYSPVQEGPVEFFSGQFSQVGIVFAPNTDCVLIFGRRGTTFHYGTGTKDPALDGTLVPGSEIEHYWFDPINQEHGTHGYPYEDYVACYRVADLLSVKNGTKKPWEITYFNKWSFVLPYETPDDQFLTPCVPSNASCHTRRYISGVTYDPVGHFIYVAAGYQDGGTDLVEPIIHVFKLDTHDGA